MNLGQFLKITLELKKYLWLKLKQEKTHNVSEVTTNKQVGSSILEVGTINVVINNHMAFIKEKIEKNIIKDVLLDGGSKVNIIIDQFILRLRLPKLKHAPYNLRMADPITIKLCV